MKATVLWFDRRDGEGMFRIENGPSGVLYACNIPGKRTWYPGTACVYYTAGQEIEIELHDTGLYVAHTPGTLDTAKWNDLKDLKLAFRCDDEGNATNGLFA